MKNKYKVSLITLLLALLGILSYLYFSHHTVAILQPRGPIALQERNLFLAALGLMLIIVIPVFFLTFYTVSKYKVGHTGKYKPDFDHSRLLEITWWIIPGILIIVLSFMTWRASYNLNPYKPIASKYPSLDIEVVALDWKWLFIYPRQGIAVVNHLVIPINRPVTFFITAEAPMNSLWIPQLSGQIYAMAGMSTELNIMATSKGNYYGSSANLSGTGFAGMHFETQAITPANFNNWVKQTKHSKLTLTYATYNKLDKNSINNPISYYKDPEPNLYTWIIKKYMAPGASLNSMTGMGM